MQLETEETERYPRDRKEDKSTRMAISNLLNKNKVFVYIIVTIASAWGIQIPVHATQVTQAKIDSASHFLQNQIDTLKLNTRHTENNVQSLEYKLDILLRLSCANASISNHDKTTSGLECK